MKRLKLLFSKEYWTKVFLIGLPICFIAEAIKSLFISSILLYTIFPVLLNESSIPIGQMISALLLLFNGVGLIKKKNWARKLVFISFPLYLLFYVLFVSIGSNDILSAILRNYLGIIFYILMLYFYTRPKVKEQFK